MGSPSGGHVGHTVPRPPLLQRISAQQWLALDVAFGFLLFLGGLTHVVTHGHAGSHDPEWLLALLLAGASVPTMFRRHFPLAALVIVTSCVAITTMSGASFAPDPLIAPPLYMVAVTFQRREAVVALGLVEVVLIGAMAVSVSRRPADFYVTFNVFLAAATWFIGDSVRSRRAYMAGLAEQEAQRQRQEMQQAERSIAEERLQIARELHDVVAHSLSVIAVQSAVGGHVLDSQPEEARNALAAVEMTSRGALEDLRRVLGVLRRDESVHPVLSPAPTVSDLNALVEQVRAAGIPVELRIGGEVHPLPSSVELSIYRIVQEALTNVVKHAAPAKAMVDVHFGPHEVSIEVVDDGHNGSVAPGRGSTAGLAGGGSEHHGIVGMRERTAVFGGTLVAAPVTGGGFRVSARLPVESGAP
ncbi:MAG TPA: sensor histidine kinase [Acidimicrobiales bacterium]|nr:sensor histidine kinase [Acidimicrobiales bacterium]